MQPPNGRPELCIDDDAQNHSMDGECQVIEADRRLLRVRVTGCILRANYGRKQEGSRVDGITQEAQEIDGQEIDRYARRRIASEVVNGLRVERSRPAEHAVMRVSSTLTFESADNATY